MNVISGLQQRADYTHKFNIKSGRHGWLRLTPAYSVKIVEEILANYDYGGRVLDPFCGSGTTALCAARVGLDVATTDINPFLIWLAQAKTKAYSEHHIQTTRQACDSVLERLGRNVEPVTAPPIHKIERWWSKKSLKFLCELKGAINQVAENAFVRDLLDIAFCRTLISLSNAAFNHQSMSFKEGCDELDLSIDREEVFRANVAHVLEGCKEQIRSTAMVALEDARSLSPSSMGAFDLVITSPPYANRMSYIRELRPYMYWLGYLKEAREAGELDWQAIGGTWGVATSRLKDWSAKNGYENDHLSSVVATIADTENKHADILSRYVHKYCEDIFSHLSSLSSVLNSGARVHYIIGNSTFYGTLVSVEQIYADIMRKIGFCDIDIRAIRKRNSKKELVEFDVSATWPRP
jgi:16S rRNA G966 N2-methylase RsmD